MNLKKNYFAYRVQEERQSPKNVINHCRSEYITFDIFHLFKQQQLYAIIEQSREVS